MNIDAVLMWWICLQTWFWANMSISCFWWRRACSVCATPLDYRIYVTCSHVFVFYMVQSFLYNSSYSSSSSTVTEIPGGFDVIQPRLPKPNPALSFWCLGWASVLLDRLPHSPPERFRPRWAMTSGQYVPLYPLPRWGEPGQHPNRVLPTKMGSTVDMPVTLSGNCPTDNAIGLPSLRSRQKSFLGFKLQKGHI